MARKREHGINCAKQLLNYARCLNNEKREELGGNPLLRNALGENPMS